MTDEDKAESKSENPDRSEPINPELDHPEGDDLHEKNESEQSEKEVKVPEKGFEVPLKEDELPVIVDKVPEKEDKVPEKDAVLVEDAKEEELPDNDEGSSKLGKVSVPVLEISEPVCDEEKSASHQVK